MHAILISFLLVILSLFSAPATLAADNQIFSTDVTLHYTFDTTGASTVKQSFAVRNLTSRYLISSYELELQGELPANFSGSDNRGKLTLQTDKLPGGSTQIRAIFNSVAAGIGKIKYFTLSHDGPQARRNDTVWEITIPQIHTTQKIDHYTIKITVPKAFGMLAFSSLAATPDDADTKADSLTYKFSQQQSATQGLSVIFGAFQTWGFRLKYELENPTSATKNFELALPMDATGQKISLATLEPQPHSISISDDGHWIATYSLDKKSKATVQITGQTRLGTQTPQRSGIPSPEILNFSPLKSTPNPNYLKPYSAEMFYDTYAATTPSLSVEWQPPRQIFLGLSTTSYLKIKNNSKSAAYSIPLNINSFGLLVNPQTTNIPVIPPLGTYSLKLNTELIPAGIIYPKRVIVNMGDSLMTYNLPDYTIISTHALIIFAISSIFLLSAAFAQHAWSLHLQKRKRSGHLHR